MKKMLFGLFFLLLGFGIQNLQAEDIYEPDYMRDRLKFSSQEIDNLTTRRLTPHTTGYYAKAVIDSWNIKKSTYIAGATFINKTIQANFVVNDFSFLAVEGEAEFRIKGGDKIKLYQNVSYTPTYMVFYLKPEFEILTNGTTVVYVISGKR